MNEKNNQDTRKAIIEASMRLFAQRGYHGTSVAQIAEATNLTKGALYWYFDSKDAIIISILDQVFERETAYVWGYAGKRSIRAGQINTIRRNIY